jgi:oxaloacetate decarboxylase alpha subunit
MTPGSEIRFVDTTLRDGNQSLWALQMSTSMLLPIASRLDEAGFSTVEIMAPAHFKSIVRDVRDDPWERVRRVSRLITKTPLAVMQQCSITGFGIVPKCIAKLWMERLAANGIRRLHLMEASNDFGLRVPDYIQYAKDAGIEVCLALTYSISPKHTDAYFAKKAAEAAACGVQAIFLKDPGGLLTPERIQTLVPAILANVGAVPVEFHSHCTTGLAPLCYLEAVRQGIRTLHTAIPPLANGSSQPSVFNVASNLRFLGYAPVLDESVIRPVAEHFKFIAGLENHPVGAPVEYDYYQYIHQIPGGVISNLNRQLAQLRLLDRLPQVIEECIRVRNDFGYPIMVTPFSQYVATQASINVVLGQRYKQVVDDLIYYALGFWGTDAAAAIDPNVMDKIMNLPRTKELKNWQPPEPTLDEMKAQFGGPGVSDDELLLRYIIGSDEDIKAMRANGPILENRYTVGQTPLATLIAELVKRRDLRHFSMNTKEVAMEIEN